MYIKYNRFVLLQFPNEFFEVKRARNTRGNPPLTLTPLFVQQNRGSVAAQVRQYWYLVVVESEKMLENTSF